MIDATRGAPRREGNDPRQIQEVSHRMRAQLVLGDDPRFRWLCDRSTIVAGKPASWRPRILAELGRLVEEQGREAMIAMAVQLCELQPRDRTALEMIRQARLEGGGSETLPLTAAIIRAVEEHRRRHPGLGPASIRTALEDAAFYLALAEEEEEEEGEEEEGEEVR
jgi:hypothetical protein